MLKLLTNLIVVHQQLRLSVLCYMCVCPHDCCVFVCLSPDSRQCLASKFNILLLLIRRWHLLRFEQIGNHNASQREFRTLCSVFVCALTSSHGLIKSLLTAHGFAVSRLTYMSYLRCTNVIVIESINTILYILEIPSMHTLWNHRCPCLYISFFAYNLCANHDVLVIIFTNYYSFFFPDQIYFHISGYTNKSLLLFVSE